MNAGIILDSFAIIISDPTPSAATLQPFECAFKHSVHRAHPVRLRVDPRVCRQAGPSVHRLGTQGEGEVRTRGNGGGQRFAESTLQG